MSSVEPRRAASRSLIGLGANLGDRRRTLDAAVQHLTSHPGVRLLAASAYHESRPVGGPSGQPPFLNAAALVETTLAPSALAAALAGVELQLGRTRGERWAARTIDLDLLLYDDVAFDAPQLVVPHPRMAFRRFVLAPAAEVAAEMLHPTIGWTIRQLLDHLDSAADYVALAGPIGAGKTELSKEIAARTGARLIADPLSEDRLASFYSDPAGQAWETEIEFLRQRAALLDRRSWPTPMGGEPVAARSTGTPLATSDFWFDQSLCYASLDLDPRRWTDFERRWRAASLEIVPPKLVVVLDAPTNVLLDRIARRGRPYECGVSGEFLDRLRSEIVRRASQPGVGPVLWLNGESRSATLSEVLAAIEAMRPPTISH